MFASTPAEVAVDALTTEGYGYHHIKEVDRAMAPVIFHYNDTAVRVAKQPQTMKNIKLADERVYTDIIGMVTESAVSGRAARYLRWLFLEYKNLSPQDVYNALRPLGDCCVLKRGRQILALVHRRGTHKTVGADMLVVRDTPPSRQGRLNINSQGRKGQVDGMNTFLEQFSYYGEEYHSNIVIEKNPGGPPTFASLLDLCRSLTKSQLLTLRAECAMVDVKMRTPFQKAVISTTSHVDQAMMPSENKCGKVDRAVAVKIGILGLDEFVGLDRLMGQRFDEQSGADVSVSLLTYATSPRLFRRYAAVLLGPPGKGKSPVARSMCYTWAMGLQSDGTPEEERYFVETSEVDSLKSVQRSLLRDTPIYFEECSFSDSCQFQHMSPNIMKLLLQIYAGGNVRARNHNVYLPPGAPRVFSSNAFGLEQFTGLKAYNPSDARELVAVRKRCFVFQVPDSIMNPELVAAGQDDEQEINRDEEAIAAGMTAVARWRKARSTTAAR